jgi:transposase-like protein
MKKIYQANNLKAAELALEKFEETWSFKYGYATRSWRKNFDELVTFFEFPTEIRKLIYTTNPIENLNRNIRKISKNKSFPNMKSLSKVIYLAINNQTKKWNAPIRDWGIIFNQLSILFDL